MYNRETILATIVAQNPGADPIELAGLFWDEVFSWWEAAEEDAYAARSMNDEEYEAAQPLRDWAKFMRQELEEAGDALRRREAEAAEAAAAEAEADTLRCESGGSRSRRYG